MFNIQITQGYLGHDPELKEFTKKDGSTGYVVNFSIGSSDRDESTDWVRCEMFGQRAKVIDKFFSKGSQILVIGRPKEEKYTAKDGTEKISRKLRVSDFSFCDSKDSPRGQSVVESDSFTAAEEDIPF